MAEAVTARWEHGRVAPRPTAPSPAGQSALAAWRRARRTQARRRALAAAAAVMALGVAAIWAGAHFVARSGWAQGWAWPASAAGWAAITLLARPRQDADRWARGAAGEQATAALLAGLAPRRWTVLHDLTVPGSRANIDHLVIGPTGLWVVDSKAFRGKVRARGPGEGGGSAVVLGRRALGSRGGLGPPGGAGSPSHRPPRPQPAPPGPALRRCPRGGGHEVGTAPAPRSVAAAETECRRGEADR